jgi:catechol-2,3-dioxygenase
MVTSLVEGGKASPNQRDRSINPRLRFTHVGLFVRDVELMANFYRDTLGLVETDRGRFNDREIIFLSGDPKEHHQIIFISGLTKPPAEEVVNQISFTIPSLEELVGFAEKLRRRQADDLQPVNHGNAWSIYFRDPERNPIEVYTPSPWYIHQPCREPLDISRPAELIRKNTHDWCKSQPGYMDASAYQDLIAARLRENFDGEA